VLVPCVYFRGLEMFYKVRIPNISKILRKKTSKLMKGKTVYMTKTEKCCIFAVPEV
jgi:hypothetical protein